MQRFSPWWLLVWIVSLYGTPQAFSSELRLAQAPGGIRELPARTQPSAPGEKAPAAPSTPHLALLLPLDSPSFGRAAEVVRQGFAAAEKAQGSLLPVRIYGAGDAAPDILAAYHRAIEAGAQAIVGPLTRDAVSALASGGDVPVPTLALNVANDEDALPPKLFLFSLQVEAEARQVARLAAAGNSSNAFVVGGETPIEKRILHAFVDEWTRLGGGVVAEIAFSAETADLLSLRQNVQPGAVVFLALEEEKARAVGPYLNPEAPAYATSQVFGGNTHALANFDLSGIRFVDMPWMLQPDHPAVMIYPRMEPPPGADLERLYALGIDAFRLVQALLRGEDPERLALDGVSGRIHLGQDRQFVRELLPARFRDGLAQVQEAPPSER